MDANQAALWWTAFGSVATAVGSMVAGVGLVMTAKGLKYAAGQLEQTKKLARGEFLLRLEELFQDHFETHKRLRRGGEWSGDEGPSTGEEWSEVEKYMGLFERINVLVKDDIINLDYVDYFYGYRILNIARNPVIRQAKLVDQAEWWQNFIELLRKIEANRQRRPVAAGDGHPTSRA
jgi:hypothetical protein